MTKISAKSSTTVHLPWFSRDASLGLVLKLQESAAGGFEPLVNRNKASRVVFTMDLHCQRAIKDRLLVCSRNHTVEMIILGEQFHLTVKNTSL